MLLRLAEKAFRPGRFPFPLMHVDTGHNFPEVLEFRDRRVAELGERLIVASVQESIDNGRAVEETGPRASRNRLQTVTLLDAIEEHRFDARSAAPAATRSAPAPRSGCSPSATTSGSGTRKNQRPELWNLYNGRIRKGEHVRVFPLSNWTELDVWQYIAAGGASSCRRSTSRTSARSSSATGCSTRRRELRRAARRRGRRSRSPCATAPSAT